MGSGERGIQKIESETMYPDESKQAVEQMIGSRVA